MHSASRLCERKPASQCQNESDDGVLAEEEAAERFYSLQTLK